MVAGETNHTANIDAILAAVTKQTKIVFLANPKNPTGSYIWFDEVNRLHRGLPSHVRLVLRAAYDEYVQRNDYESGIDLFPPATMWSWPDFLQNSRVGRVAPRLDVGPADVIAAINRIRGPFNVNAPSIAAGIAHRGFHHQERAREHNARWLAWLSREIEQLGLKSDPERR